MDFLSNLFGRLFGKKREDQPQDQPQAPRPQVTVSNAQAPVQSAPVPQPAQVSQPQPYQPTISASSLVKVPQSQEIAPPAPQPAPQQQEPSFLQKIGNFLNPMANGGVGHAIDYLNSGNSPIGENGYFNKQIIQPVSTGLKKVVLPSTSGDGSLWGNTKSVGSGVLEAGRGAFNASPLGIAANGAISSVSGALKAIRGESVNPLKEFNDNSQISEGLGVQNPVAKALIDIPTNFLAANPMGTVAGLGELGNVAKADSLAEAGSSAFSGIKNILGLNHETSGFANQNIGDIPTIVNTIKSKITEVVPGVKSVNPAKLQEAEQAATQAIATLTPRENPNAGQITNPFGDQTVEDAQLAVPTFQRNQEAARAAYEAQRLADESAKVTAPQGLNDMLLSKVDPQSIDANPGLIPVDNPRYIQTGGTMSDIRPPLQKVASPVEVQPAAPVIEPQPVVQQTPPISEPTPPSFNNKGYEKGTAEKLSQNMQKASDKFGEESHVESIGKPLDSIPPEEYPNVVSIEDRRIDKTKDGIDVVGEIIGTRHRNGDVVGYTIDAPVEASVSAPEVPTQQSPFGNIDERVNAAVGPEVPVAPRTYDAVRNGLKDAASKIEAPKGKATDLEELARQSKIVVDQLEDADLVQALTSKSIDDIPMNEKGFSVLREARNRLDRLAQENPDDAAVRAALDNTFEAMADRASKYGLGQRVVQEEFDKMPVSAKVRYLTKSVDKANANVEGYVPLSQRPEEASIIDATLNNLLRKSQEIGDNIAELETKAQGALDGIKAGERPGFDVGEVTGQIAALKRDLEAQNGESAKYFKTLVPDKSAYKKLVSDVPRTAMLSSLTGRVNDLVTTANNVVDLMSRQVVQAPLSAAANLVKKGSATNPLAGMGELFKAVPGAISKTYQEMRGTQYAGDLQKAVKGGTELRSGSSGNVSPVGRVVRSLTEFPTHLTEGVKNQRLYQLALQEAAKLDIPSDMAKEYATLRASIPSKNMEHTAETLHREINNINDNPITRTLNKVAAALDGKSGVGDIILSQTAPFRSWLGGNIWNSLTDKNVLASAYKVADSALKGDTEGTIENLSKFAVGGAKAYAAATVLSDMGILTDHDANGDKYSAAYLHIGDRYIPIGILGFSAPNVMLGFAYHQAMSAPEGENKATVFADTIGKYVISDLALGQAVGADTGLSRAMDAATRQGGNVMDGVAMLGGNIVGQYVPALTGDINAILNNYTGLNPTHEAADTKAVDPNSPSGNARDYVGTAINQLENKIPVVSQLSLPRQEGVAAPDLLDKVTHGNRDTSSTIGARLDEAASQDETMKRVAADKESGLYSDSIRSILDKDTQKIFDKARDGKQVKPDDYDKLLSAVTKNLSETDNSRFLSDGKYDENLAVLKAKYSILEKDPTTRSDTLDAYKKQINRGEVYKELKTPYKSIQDYAKTDLGEWRDLGDPKSDTYDPKKYQELWNLDSALADKGASGNSDDAATGKYSAKKKKKGGNGVSNRISSNTIGTPLNLGNISLSKIVGQSTGLPSIPRVAKLKTSELLKKRKISVSR